MLFYNLILILFDLVLTEIHHPIVEISDGKLKGKILQDYEGNDFFSFLSIPYAKPPILEERFKDPKPVDKWSGIRNATEDLPICYQKLAKGVYLGTEDCLYLNVHTPKISTDNLKPVMVYIHGGGFTEGTGRYDQYGPEFLITNGIVLVTLNYRLGLFGFLHFDNSNLEIFGNAGLKDQSMALKWVKNNIKKFGGDPDNITIFGESAGAVSVHMHVISEASQGLFHKAIIMSGVANAVWADGTQNNGVQMARMLGYQGDDELEMSKLLQNSNFEEIESALDELPFLIPILHTQNFFGPVIEYPTKYAFLKEDARSLIKKGNFNKIPLMIGYTDQEGMIIEVIYRLRYGKYDQWPVDWYIPKHFNLTREIRETLCLEIKNFYFKNNRNSQEDINLTSDGYFTFSIQEALIAHTRLNQDVFFYIFTSDNKMNRYKFLNPITATKPGACHADELGNIFTSTSMHQPVKESSEEKSIKVIVGLFANFAKSGNPTSRGFGVQWEKLDLKKMNYLRIKNDEVDVGYDPNKERVQFWIDISKKYCPEGELLFDIIVE